MRTEIVSQEKNKVVVKANFTAEDVTKAIQKTYNKLSKKTNLKGFRKGKVPFKTINLYFGKKVVLEEALEEILSTSLDEIVNEYGFKLIAEPDLKPEPIEEDKPYEFTVIFEVSPEVILPDLETIEAEKTVYIPTEKMVEENVTRLLEAHSELEPSYEEREINKDDHLSVKFTTSILDAEKTIKELEKDKKIEIHLGEANMRPEVVKGLIGKKPGETVKIEFPVEKDNEHKELAGKTMVYNIEVLGIMNKVTPELNDEKVTKITRWQNKTVSEFKDEIMKQLKISAAQKSEDTLKDSALTQIIEKTEVELPESLIERQKAAMKTDQEERLKRESGMSMEEFYEKSGITKEKYEEELSHAAVQGVKRSLVLEAIAEDNDINWTGEEIEAELRSIALNSRIDYKKLQEYAYSNNDYIYEIATRIKNRKTVDFIMTKVKVREIEETKSKNADKKEEKASKNKKEE